jgi:hypothetical protein
MMRVLFEKLSTNRGLFAFDQQPFTGIAYRQHGDRIVSIHSFVGGVENKSEPVHDDYFWEDAELRLNGNCLEWLGESIYHYKGELFVGGSILFFDKAGRCRRKILIGEDGIDLGDIGYSETGEYQSREHFVMFGDEKVDYCFDWSFPQKHVERVAFRLEYAELLEVRLSEIGFMRSLDIGESYAQFRGQLSDWAKQAALPDAEELLRRKFDRERVFLCGIGVDDASIKIWMREGSFSEATRIQLYKTGVTDSGMLELHALPSLKELEVVSDIITALGIESFLKNKPHCHVAHFSSAER